MLVFSSLCRIITSDRKSLPGNFDTWSVRVNGSWEKFRRLRPYQEGLKSFGVESQL